MNRTSLKFLVALGFLIAVAAGFLEFLRPGVHLTPEARDLAKADRLAKLGNWEAAGPIFARLERRYRALGDARNQIYAHVSRFGSEEESSNLQDISREMQLTLSKQIVQNDLALKQRCLEIKSHIDLNLDGVSARPSLEALGRIAKQRGDGDAESRASGELGILAFLEGNPSEAKSRVLGALARAIVHRDKGAEIRYLALMGEGLAETQKNDLAIWFLNRALSVSRSDPDAGFPQLVIAGKATALTQMRRFTESNILIQEGLSYARSHGYIGFEVDMLAQSGYLSESENRNSEAIEFYRQAADRAAQIRFNRGLAEVNAQLAALYRRAGNLPQAEICEENSMRAHVLMGEVYELPHHLAVQADLQEALGNRDAAEITYSTAERIIGTMLHNSPTASLKKFVVASMSEVYVGHFRLAAHQNDIVKAYDVIEEARGRVASDRLLSPDQDHRSRPDITAGERKLAILQMRLLDTTDSRERHRLSDSLTEFEQQMTPEEESTQNIKDRERPSLVDLQNVLAPNEEVLEYVLGDTESYCLVVTSKGRRLVRLAARKAIEGLAEKHLSAIESKRSAAAEGRDLFSAVVAPLGDLPEGINLIVVPDGTLHRIPFSTLVDGTNHYLIESHSISYAPSSSVLAEIRKESAVSLKAMLAVGNVSYGGGSPREKKWVIFRGLDSLERNALTPLPATGDEIRTVAAALHNLNGVILSGDAATESNFKQEVAKGTSVVHLALHAFSDKAYPERSALVFAAGGNGDDGLLQVREIRRLPLSQTSLVTLSACDTSDGPIEGEEGVSSIVYAFLYAGARTAVSSFWMIEDSSTAELMRSFYTEMSHGQPVVVALRTAQLEMLARGAETKAPFYWAAFGAIGDASHGIEGSKP
jgi:CHAT domain-containing protein/tetratricopeptide (TPR) repeat protein